MGNADTIHDTNIPRYWTLQISLYHNSCWQLPVVQLFMETNADKDYPTVKIPFSKAILFYFETHITLYMIILLQHVTSTWVDSQHHSSLNKQKYQTIRSCMWLLTSLSRLSYFHVLGKMTHSSGLVNARVLRTTSNSYFSDETPQVYLCPLHCQN